MTHNDIALRGETPDDADAIALLHEEAFGPGRFARAAERVREGGPHDLFLSHVAVEKSGTEGTAEVLIGSVRMTPIVIGAKARPEGRSGIEVVAGRAGHLLGPLAVTPRAKLHGIGGRLLSLACEKAFARGSSFVLLVGDPPFYLRHGFEPVRGPVLPGPVDPARILVRWSEETRRTALAGPVRHAGQEPHSGRRQETRDATRKRGDRPRMANLAEDGR